MKGLRITLVELPATVDGRLDDRLAKDVYSLFRFPARGVLLLESVCRRTGYDDIVTIIPQYNRVPGYLDAGDWKRLADTDVLGLSVITRTANQSFELARRVRLVNPRVKILFGGPHPTALPEESLQFGDVVVTHEGDYTLPLLLERLEDNLRDPYLTDLQGVNYLGRDSEIIRNPDRPYLTSEELSALPFPVYIRTRLLDTTQGVPRPSDIPTFAEMADQFLAWAKTNLAPATVRLHKVNVAKLKKFYKGRLLTEIDRKSVEQFKVWRAGQKRETGEGKVSGATVNRNLTTLKRIFNYADAMELNVRNPVRHVPFFKETGRLRALTFEEVDKYVAAAKGDLKDFAVLAVETGARPMELLALHKKDVHLAEGYVSLPGTKNKRALRDVPLSDDAKEVLERRIAASSNGYIFPVRRPKVKNKEVDHISSLKGAHEKVIKDCFPDDPFTAYTFRHTNGTRHAQAGTELPVLAELMGHAEIQTTMIYVHASKKMKIEATEKLQAYVEAAKKAKQLQQEQEAESCKPMEDEWGVPIYESDASYPQNPPQSLNSENSEDDISHI